MILRYLKLSVVFILFIFYLQWFRHENYFSILDFINLPFHEAGHIFLSPFGRFIMMSGGTIFQLLIPAVCAVNLYLKEYYFGSKLCVFWIGENFLNISVYASDAIKRELPLVGGGEHDWTYLLTETGLIGHTILVGKVIFWTGSLVIFYSLYIMARDAFKAQPDGGFSLKF